MQFPVGVRAIPRVGSRASTPCLESAGPEGGDGLSSPGVVVVTEGEAGPGLGIALAGQLTVPWDVAVSC